MSQQENANILAGCPVGQGGTIAVAAEALVVVERREAFGVREACFRFFIAVQEGLHAIAHSLNQSGSKLPALQTLREVQELVR